MIKTGQTQLHQRQPGDTMLEQSDETVRQEEVHGQAQPSGRPTRQQSGPGSQNNTSKPHNIFYELHCRLRLSAPIGIFRNTVKEWIGSLRLTAEADLALESQSPIDDSSLLRMRVLSALLGTRRARLTPLSSLPRLEKYSGIFYATQYPLHAQ